MYIYIYIYICTRAGARACAGSAPGAARMGTAVAVGRETGFFHGCSAALMHQKRRRTGIVRQPNYYNYNYNHYY